MKRRWAFIAWPSLACLIGLSWMAKNFGLSAWNLMGIHMLGMVIACFGGFLAMRAEVRERWPAVLALAGSAPMLVQNLGLLRSLDDVIKFFGPSSALWIAGSFLTSLAALVLAFLPPAPLPEPPPVAPARVIED